MPVRSLRLFLVGLIVTLILAGSSLAFSDCVEVCLTDHTASMCHTMLN